MQSIRDRCVNFFAVGRPALQSVQAVGPQGGQILPIHFPHLLPRLQRHLLRRIPVLRPPQIMLTVVQGSGFLTQSILGFCKLFLFVNFSNSQGFQKKTGGTSKHVSIRITNK